MGTDETRSSTRSRMVRSQFRVRGQHDGRGPSLPGRPGSRVVCVANLRPQKSHLDLLRAFAQVARQTPEAHFCCWSVARRTPPMHGRCARQSERSSSGLTSRCSANAPMWQPSFASVIGVLSSVSEGFPLALVEYGLAGLPVVSTDVGQCSEMLDNGKAGMLVAAGNPGSPRCRNRRLVPIAGPRIRLGSACVSGCARAIRRGRGHTTDLASLRHGGTPVAVSRVALPLRKTIPSCTPAPGVKN